VTRYGIRDGRTIEVDIPPGWAICCDCGDMWLLMGPGHYCARRLMREPGAYA
jgi:hypothetical protein